MYILCKADANAVKHYGELKWKVNAGFRKVSECFKFWHYQDNRHACPSKWVGFMSCKCLLKCESTWY